MISTTFPTQTAPRAGTPGKDHPGIEASFVTDEEIAATRPDFVDVSHHQGDIDWAKYAASGRTMAVCKLTEGGDWNDDTAAANRAGMSAQNLKCGLYHFARPQAADVVADATFEAEHYLTQAGTFAKNEFPVLDFEVINGLTADQLTTWASKWCSIVEDRTGKTPWLYTSNKIKNQVDGAQLSKYPLWLADYRTNDKEHPPDSSPWPTMMTWQYTDKAIVPGINGKVDGNYLYGTLPPDPPPPPPNPAPNPNPNPNPPVPPT